MDHEEVGRHPFEWPWKRWTRERRELKQWHAWITGQFRALEAGEEIEPPWIAWPGEDPWWIGWRQGNPEGWLQLVWLPFWSKLDRGEKQAYIERWKIPPEWRPYVLDGDGSDDYTEHCLADFVLNKGKFKSPEP